MFEGRIAEWLDQGRALVEATSRDAVDAVLTWEQIISSAQASQLRSTAAVAEEAPEWITTNRGRTELSDVQVAGAELAPALRLARVTAQNRVHFAKQVTGRLPDSLAALAAGVITMPKLKAIEEATAVLSPDLAHRVETMILPAAGEKTPGELRVALAKAAIRVDPAAAEKRRKTAIGDRKVVKVPLPDGVAGLWAVMAAERTTAAFTVIDTLARLAKAPDDDRGMDALRADALFGLITDAHDQLTGNTPSPTTSTGEPNPDGTPSQDTKERRPQRSTRLYSVQVAVAAETLTGDNDDPGELAGYGPITAEAARELIGDDTALRRLLVDPVTGSILDVGRTRYLPTEPIVNHVMARDRTCRHPGCRQPAYRCDLDHCHRYPEGPTAHTNLATVCRFHHRLKHHTKWDSTMDDAGVVTWSSPTSRTYVTYPWDYRTGARLSEPPTRQAAGTDGESTVDGGPPDSSSSDPAAA